MELGNSQRPGGRAQGCEVGILFAARESSGRIPRSACFLMGARRSRPVCHPSSSFFADQNITNEQDNNCPLQSPLTADQSPGEIDVTSFFPGALPSHKTPTLQSWEVKRPSSQIPGYTDHCRHSQSKQAFQIVRRCRPKVAVPGHRPFDHILRGQGERCCIPRGKRRWVASTVPTRTPEDTREHGSL